MVFKKEDFYELKGHDRFKCQRCIKLKNSSYIAVNMVIVTCKDTECENVFCRECFDTMNDNNRFQEFKCKLCDTSYNNRSRRRDAQGRITISKNYKLETNQGHDQYCNDDTCRWRQYRALRLKCSKCPILIAMSEYEEWIDHKRECPGRPDGQIQVTKNEKRKAKDRRDLSNIAPMAAAARALENHLNAGNKISQEVLTLD